MKKLIALFTIVAVVGVLAAAVYARTAQEELEAVRGYLVTLDSKIVSAREAGQKSKVAWLQKEKEGTLRRLAKLKADAEAEKLAPAPIAAPVVKAAPSGLFGLGWQTAASVGYVMDKSVIALRGDFFLPDPLALGTIVGLPSDSVVYRVGLGYTTGNDHNDVSWRSVPLYLDGVIMLPMAGLDTYIGGGLNYILNRSGSKAGTIGGQIYLGIQGDLGLGAKTFAELGYTILRAGSEAPLHSSKGFSINVGQRIVL